MDWRGELYSSLLIHLSLALTPNDDHSLYTPFRDKVNVKIYNK